MTGAVNLRDLFFDDPAQAADAMTAALLGKPDGEVGTAVRDLPDVTRTAALTRLTEAATGLLGQDVSDVFCTAWRKHRVIWDEAVASLAEPDARRVVGLATHAISFAHEPCAELRIGDRKVAAVALQVHLDLLIKGCGR